MLIQPDKYTSNTILWYLYDNKLIEEINTTHVDCMLIDYSENSGVIVDLPLDKLWGSRDGPVGGIGWLQVKIMRNAHVSSWKLFL